MPKMFAFRSPIYFFAKFVLAFFLFQQFAPISTLQYGLLKADFDNGHSLVDQFVNGPRHQGRLKILVFAPSHVNNRSHVYFTVSIVRILQQKHDVLFIVPITRLEDKMNAATTEELGIRYYLVENRHKMTEAEENVASFWDVLKSRDFVFYAEAWIAMLKDAQFMEMLNAAKFDVGIAEMHRAFGHAFGIFHALNLPYTVNIKAYSPHAVQYAGLGLTEAMNENNYPTPDLHNKWINGKFDYKFAERVEYKLNRMPSEDKEMLEQPVRLFPGFRHSEDGCCKYPGQAEAFRRARFFFINSQPQIEFDGGQVVNRANAKVRWIGGIHMQQNDAKEEEKSAEMFKPITEKINAYKQTTSAKLGHNSTKIGGIILVTFGTVVDTIKEMDDEQFKTMLNGIVRAYPQYFVVWQLTKGDKRIEQLNQFPNVYSAHFVPQRTILADSRTKAFFSHCGRNSQMEGTFSGVPVICVPRLFDQFYNGLSMENQRIGYELDAKCTKPGNVDAQLNPHGTDEDHCFTESAIRDTLYDAFHEKDLLTSLKQSRIDLAKLRRIKQQMQGINPSGTILEAMDEIVREIRLKRKINADKNGKEMDEEGEKEIKTVHRGKRVKLA